MPMLAEPKRKKKWILMPKKPMWAADANGVNFGQKLLEKMGWCAGKGLGANEQGIQEPLRVSYKNDTIGMGYKLNDDELITQQNEFNDLLMQLSGSTDSSKPHQVSKTEISSLEEKSKQSKCRVHYQKFTRGKDLSRYSENDLACIFGVNKKKTENNISEENPEKYNTNKGDQNKSFGLRTIQGGSLTDYFKNKQTEIKLRAKKTCSEFENSDSLIQETDEKLDGEKLESSEVEFQERNPKKRKCLSPFNELHCSEADAYIKISDCSDDVAGENKGKESNGYKIYKKKFKENCQTFDNNNQCEIQPDSVKPLKTSMICGIVNLENRNDENLAVNNGNKIYEKTSCKKRKYSMEKSSVHHVENANIEMEEKFFEQNKKLKKKQKSLVESELNSEQATQSNEIGIDQHNESHLGEFNSIAEVKDVKSVKKKKHAKEKKIDSTLNTATGMDAKKLKEDNVECREMEEVLLKRKKKDKKKERKAVFEEKSASRNSDPVNVKCSEKDENETSLNEMKPEIDEMNVEVQLKKKKKDKRKKEKAVFDEKYASCNADLVEVECSKKDENETRLNEIKSEINEMNEEVQLKKKKKDKRKEGKAVFDEKSASCNSDSVNVEFSKKDKNETSMNEMKPEIDKMNEEVLLKKKKKDKRKKEKAVFDEKYASCNSDLAEVECINKDENEIRLNEMKSEIDEINKEVQLKKKKKDKRRKERAVFDEKSASCNSDSVNVECSKKDENETLINKSEGEKNKKKGKPNNLSIESMKQKEDTINGFKPEVNESVIETEEKKRREKEKEKEKVIISNNEFPTEEEKTCSSEIEPKLQCTKKKKEKKRKEKKDNFNNESVEEKKTGENFIVINDVISDCEKTNSKNFDKKKKKKEDKLLGDCPNKEGKEMISSREESNTENSSEKEKNGCENKEGKKVENSDSSKEVENNGEKRFQKKNLKLASETKMKPESEVVSTDEIVEKKANEADKVKGEANEIVKELKTAMPKMEWKPKVEGTLKGNSSESNCNVIHTHKMTLFNKKTPPIVAFPAGMTNSKALKLFFGARIDDFRGSNLGKLEGYGKALRSKGQDLERPTTI